MTVNVSTTRDDTTGDGSTTTFPFTFRLSDETHLDAYVNGVQLTYPTDFTVTIDSSGVGGDVTHTTAPANNADIVYIRNVPYTQPTALPLSQGIPKGTLEAAYDRAVMMIQQLREAIDRTISLPVTSTLTGLTFPEPDALKLLQWNSAEDGLQNAEITTSTFTVPSFTGNALEFPRVNAGETNFEYRTAAEVWTQVSGLPISNKTGAYTAVAADNGTMLTLAGTFTLSLTAAATLGDKWWMAYRVTSGTVTVDPNSSEQIDGASTKTLSAGDSGFIICNGSAFFTISSSASSLSAASQAEMEAASSTTVYATPGRVQYHPGVAKAWAMVTVSGGTPTVAVGYNTSSIGDNGVGDFTHNVTTAFSTANFACLLTSQRSTVPGGTTSNTNPGTAATTSSIRTIFYEETSAFLNLATDVGRWSIVEFGDQ